MSQTPLACLNRVKRVKINGAWTARPEASLFTHLIVEAVVDRSGSMGNLWTSTSQGMDNFLHSQRRLARSAGIKTTFSLTTFDDTAETYFDKVNLATLDLPLLDAAKQKMFYPRGMTLLVDTLMQRLCAASRTRNELLASMTPAERQNANIGGLILINTDGQDNQSRIFTSENIKDKITKMKGDGFTFMFMAANQDAIGTAATFGIGAGAAITYTPTPQANAECWRSAVANARQTSTGVTTSYTQVQRDASAPSTAPPFAAPPRPALGARAQTGIGAHRCHYGARLHRPAQFPMPSAGNLVLPLPVHALSPFPPPFPPPPPGLRRAGGVRGHSGGHC